MKAVTASIEGKATLWGIESHVTPMGERVSATAGSVQIVGGKGMEKIDIPAGAMLHVCDGETVWPGAVLAQYQR